MKADTCDAILSRSSVWSPVHIMLTKSHDCSQQHSRGKQSSAVGVLVSRGNSQELPGDVVGIAEGTVIYGEGFLCRKGVREMLFECQSIVCT